MNISMTLTADKAADFEKLALVFSALADSSCAPGVKSGDSALKLHQETSPGPVVVVPELPPMKMAPVSEKSDGTPVKSDANTPTLEEVRKASKAKIDDGKQDQVKEVLGIFGANRLTELDKSNYAAFLVELEKI